MAHGYGLGLGRGLSNPVATSVLSEMPHGSGARVVCFAVFCSILPCFAFWRSEALTHLSAVVITTIEKYTSDNYP